MDEQNQDGSEVLETTETDGEQDETATEETQETDQEKEELKKKLADLESKNKQLFERLKKEEGKEKSELSPKDLLALSKADLHPDDLDELQEFASFKKLSLADALNAPMMKAMLADRAAERKTAEATQTKGARGTTKPQGEEILRKAETTGEVPESTEGLQELWRARMARNKK